MNKPIYYNLKWFHFSHDFYRTDTDRLLHHEMWETAYGKVPAGGRIIFVDGDSTNCYLMNLSMRLPPAPLRHVVVHLPQLTGQTKWQ